MGSLDHQAVLQPIGAIGGFRVGREALAPQPYNPTGDHLPIVCENRNFQWYIHIFWCEDRFQHNLLVSHLPRYYL